MLKGFRLACALLLLPVTSSAQALPGTHVPGPSRLSGNHTEDAAFEQSGRAGTAAQPRRDSLWNGALIGAGVGTLLGIGLGSAALPSTPEAGFNVPLTFGVIGAGAGLGLGMWIDSLRHDRRASAPPTTRQRRVVVSTVVGASAKGMVAAIDF